MGMTPQGNGKYTGKVWRPSNGKIYNGKMQVSGKTLKNVRLHRRRPAVQLSGLDSTQVTGIMKQGRDRRAPRF